MTSGPSINIGSLDFDEIKDSLKTYLRAQSEFTDYDFEGAGLSVLLDLLAANTHYLGFYSNMVANESFLDTAATRTGVVSLAKLLGYTPRSQTAARAVVNINFGTTRPLNSLSAEFDYLDPGYTFTGTANRETYGFTTRKSYKLEVNADNEYVINDVELVEGAVFSQNYVVNETNPDQKFVIPTDKADTDTLVVRIQKSISDRSGFSDVWLRNTDFSSIGSDSSVYFLQELDNGRYEIFFGDGILGRKPRNGNYVTVQYLVSNGPEANGLGKSDTSSNPTFTANLFPRAKVTVVSPAAGGAIKENIQSIKFNAPRAFQSQERAVTADDYRTIVFSHYPNAESVYVYGGEDADPPQYGKVFVAIKPAEGSSLTAIEKRNLASNVIGTRNVLGIIPEIVDPDLLYLKLVVDVLYDPNATTLAETDVENTVIQSLRLFSNNELSKFDRGLVLSQLTRNIDDSLDAILGSEVAVTLQKRLELKLGTTQSYELDYNNELYHPHTGHTSVITSTGFSYSNGTAVVTAFLDDDGDGTLRLYELIDGVKTYITSNIGTVNYTTGKLNLVNFAPSGVSGATATISVDVKPNKQNILSKRNTVITIDESDSESRVVNASIENITRNVDSVSGNPFPFKVDN